MIHPGQKGRDMPVEWQTVFDEAFPEPGANAEEIAQFVESIRKPLSCPPHSGTRNRH